MAAHVQIIKLIRGGLHLQYNSTYSPAGRTETNHAKQSDNISVSDPDPDRSGFFSPLHPNVVKPDPDSDKVTRVQNTG